jgi:hypothetical protein
MHCTAEFAGDLTLAERCRLPAVVDASPEPAAEGVAAGGTIANGLVLATPFVETCSVHALPFQE